MDAGRPHAHPGHRPRRAGRGGALGARERGRPGRRPEHRGHRARRRPPSVVAVVSGDGIGRIFRSLGVHHLVVGGQTMNPATADLVKAVESVGSDQVVILPNNKNIRPVAEQVDALSDKTVRVVATGSIVEGFAALLAYDPAADGRRQRRLHVRVGRPRRAGRGHPGRARHGDRRRRGARGRLHRDLARRRRGRRRQRRRLHPPAAEPPARRRRTSS